MLQPDSSIRSDYLWRYVAYGAAIDLLTDYREFEVLPGIERKFEKYRGLVYARTMQQQQNQRSTPRF